MKVRIIKDDWHVYVLETEAYLKELSALDIFEDQMVEVPKSLVDEYVDIMSRMHEWQGKIEKYASK